MNDKYIDDEQRTIGDGLTFIAAAIGMSAAGIRGIGAPDHSHHGWMLPVLATIVVVKMVVLRRSHKLRVEPDDILTATNSWQHLAEALTLIATFLGFSIALLGWATADDWASVGAAAVMGYCGVAILLSAFYGAKNSRDRGSVVAVVRSAAANVSTVFAVEELLVRRSAGSYRVVIHVQAHPSISLSDAYSLGGRVESAIQHAIPSVRQVLVHVEPYRPIWLRRVSSHSRPDRRSSTLTIVAAPHRRTE
jgi:divalent metal cation (Fe/Co/Zn/Cd) transporter